MSTEQKIRKLIRAYRGQRASYYRRWIKAHKCKDEGTELVYGALQLAYMQMQVDLEKMLR